MVATIERTAFRSNAVYIPVKDGKEGRDFDREDCMFLFVDGEYSYGAAYTEQAWKDRGEPSYVHRRGDFFLPDDIEITVGRVQLLPDTCIVKVPEREWWCPGVQAMTKRIYGVYALDRRQRFHLCEFCASYELHFLESQYETTDEVGEDEGRREELHQIILSGDRDTERVSYFHVKDIAPLFLRGRRCRPGWLPESDQGGGYRLRGLTAVTWDGVMEEIGELMCTLTI